MGICTLASAGLRGTPRMGADAQESLTIAYWLEVPVAT